MANFLCLTFLLWINRAAHSSSTQVYMYVLITSFRIACIIHSIITCACTVLLHVSCTLIISSRVTCTMMFHISCMCTCNHLYGATCSHGGFFRYSNNGQWTGMVLMYCDKNVQLFYIIGFIYRACPETLEYYCGESCNTWVLVIRVLVLVTLSSATHWPHIAPGMWKTLIAVQQYQRKINSFAGEANWILRYPSCISVLQEISSYKQLRKCDKEKGFSS